MTQSLQELEQDIEQSRAKLDQTIDRLQGKMTVSGVIDDMLGTARNGRYAPVFDEVLVTIRRNPIPIMLLAAGLGLLAYNLGRKPRIRRTAPPAPPPLPTEPEMMAEPGDIRVYTPGASSLHAPLESQLEPHHGMSSRTQRF